MKVPEQYRVKNHPLLGSDSSFKNNGFFVIPHPKISLYYYQCQVSDGMGWEHVSISIIKDVGNRRYKMVERCPTWGEMCYIKSLFWNDDAAVMQLHPPKSQYVNNHEYCLHLWRPIYTEIPLPDSIMVGIK